MDNHRGGKRPNRYPQGEKLVESTARQLTKQKTKRVSRPRSYPHCPEGLPEFEFRQGAYRTRFARTWRELDEVFRLRYQVFNRELGEGLALSEASQRDEDRFDAGCHHLIVRNSRDDEVVGTYRLMTDELAARGPGFYSSREFDLASVPTAILREGVELGRACIAKTHRGRRVLFHLWRGIGAYLVHNRKRYLFGCASVPTLDPVELAALVAALQSGEHLHPSLSVPACPGFAAAPAPAPSSSARTPETPSLMRSYFSLGAKVCGGPALDREFGTADYWMLLDAKGVDDDTYRRYTSS